MGRPSGVRYSRRPRQRCKMVRGNVIFRHTEVLDVLCDISAQAFGASAVRKEVVLMEGDGEWQRG